MSTHVRSSIFHFPFTSVLRQDTVWFMKRMGCTLWRPLLMLGLYAMARLSLTRPKFSSIMIDFSLVSYKLFHRHSQQLSSTLLSAGQSCHWPDQSSQQGSHRLEKYLNIQDCLEKSLKVRFVLKSIWKTLKNLEKSLNFTIYRRIQQCFWRPKSV